MDDDGGFSLTEYEETEIPPYAILSHTWGPSDEEVTYRDMKEGTGKSKAGYLKAYPHSKQYETVCTSFGSTHAVSISRATRSFQKLSILLIGGIAMLRGAMFTFLM
jgi:hypothetical protein